MEQRGRALVGRGDSKPRVWSDLTVQRDIRSRGTCHGMRENRSVGGSRALGRLCFLIFEGGGGVIRYVRFVHCISKVCTAGHGTTLYGNGRQMPHSAGSSARLELRDGVLQLRNETVFCGSKIPHRVAYLVDASHGI